QRPAGERALGAARHGLPQDPRARVVRPVLSLVIPAYNEERRLGAGLRQALDYLRKRGEPFEILVVDDGSRDRTREVADSFAGEEVRLLRHERNRGKGAAIRTG